MPEIIANKIRILLLVLFSILASIVSGQSKRLALVIGNENYENLLSLYNPVNDANSIHLALTDAGFEVYKYLDLDKKGMQAAIDEFGRMLEKYDVGLFFYAGHGIQFDGINYLIPVDADLKNKENARDKCVEVQSLLKYMESANNKTNIVILDACRQNPFAKSWSRGASSEGLAFMNAPTGSILAFSTSPGKFASDGQGQNGLYTEALLKYIQLPGLKIEEVFKRVRSMVREKSGGSQVPWENVSLVGDFYFYPEGEFTGTKDYTDEKVNSTGIPAEKDNKNMFTDPRDGQVYRTVELGKQLWMAENLNFETPDSWCYSNSMIYCRTYGRLYSYEAALEACPPGWRMASDEDWMELEMFLGMSFNMANGRDIRGTDQGNRLKAAGKEFWLQNDEEYRDEYGFSVLPAGIRSPDGTYHLIGTNAYFFTSTPYSEYSIWGREFSLQFKGIARKAIPRYTAFSVRCVK